jgi:hypothetical protein
MGWYFRVSKADVGYARPIALALRKPRLTAAALRLAVEVLRSFFAPQFANAIARRRPVVNVDHPLDAMIPFEPGYVGKYLEFMKLWMGTFYSLWCLYGDAAIPELAAYVDSIRALYADAGKVYLTVHTTTTRPAKNYNLRFAIIHATDPHLNCIPSLHVLIVAANWMLAERFMASVPRPDRAPRRGFDAAAWLDSLRGEALAITESVLFVKQHSVNCVGASLYCLRRFFPCFEGERSEDFVRDLFSGKTARGGASTRIEPQLAERLRLRMREVRDELEAVFGAGPERGWSAPILEFIAGYAE